MRMRRMDRNEDQHKRVIAEPAHLEAEVKQEADRIKQESNLASPQSAQPFLPHLPSIPTHTASPNGLSIAHRSASVNQMSGENIKGFSDMGKGLVGLSKSIEKLVEDIAASRS
jgi:hypothetical protein